MHAVYAMLAVSFLSIIVSLVIICKNWDKMIKELKDEGFFD